MSKYASANSLHKCLNGCPYATVIDNIVMCPFVEGSCAKIPQTLTEPNKSLIGLYDRYPRRFSKNVNKRQR